MLKVALNTINQNQPLSLWYHFINQILNFQNIFYEITDWRQSGKFLRKSKMMFVSFNSTTSVTSGAGTANPFGAPSLPLLFSCVCVARSLVFLCFCVMFCRSLLVLFFLAIELTVLLWLTAPGYPFWYLQIFLNDISYIVPHLWRGIHDLKTTNWIAYNFLDF